MPVKVQVINVKIGRPRQREENFCRLALDNVFYLL
jgi:hypothetical protein